MEDSQFTPTNAQMNDAESMSYAFGMLMGGYFFVELVKVLEIRGEAPGLVVDVLPLVARKDQTGAMVNNSTVYDVPVWRLQRGTSAIVMNPVAGDIGLIAICDRDTSLVRANRKESAAGSNRRHNKSDAVYLGGLLNGAPDQVIEFADGAINIRTPNPVNINCSSANITAPSGVTVTSPTMHVTGNITAAGDITDNNGSQGASLKTLRDAYDRHKHQVQGVESGNSTLTSNQTDAPA